MYTHGLRGTGNGAHGALKNTSKHNKQTKLHNEYGIVHSTTKYEIHEKGSVEKLTDFIHPSL